jgi:nucleotide-binding universal stress UspA family protein
MYDRILVPTDGESMDRVYDHALDIAAQRGATVHLLYVVDDRAFLTLDERMRDDVLAELESEGAAATTSATDRFAAADVETVTATARGDPADEILAYAEANDVDLVVMGTRRRNYRESMVGSVSQKVIARSDSPVLTVGLADAE